MKKILTLALVLAGAFLFATSASAQNFTTVTATVKDPNGIPYAGGTVSAVCVPGSSGGYRLAGQPYPCQIGSATLDPTGTFTVQFGSNAQITPASTQWQITVRSNPGGIQPPLGTGAQAFTVTMTISGATQNISSTLNAAAPALTNFASGSSGSITGCSTTGGVGFENGTANTLTCGAALVWLPTGGANGGLVATVAPNSSEYAIEALNSGTLTSNLAVVGGVGEADVTVNTGTTAGDLIGWEGSVRASGSANLSDIEGLSGVAQYTGTGTVAIMAANFASGNFLMSGTATKNVGFYAQDQSGVGSANYDFYAEPVMLGGTNFQYFAAASGTSQLDALQLTNTLNFLGSTSGNAKLGVAAVAGTPCQIDLPTASPSLGQVLTTTAPSGGVCQTSWATPASSSITNQVAKAISSNAGGSATAIDSTVCTPPAVAGQYTVGYFPTTSAAVAPTCPQIGLAARAVTGTTATDTLAFGDNNNAVRHEESVANAVTLPTPTTLGNPNFFTCVQNATTGSSTAVTVTPTTLTINGAASLVITQGQAACIYPDPSAPTTNWLAQVADAPLVAGSNITLTRSATGGVTIAASSGTPSFPLTVTGTVISGGIPYFNSTTQESSSGVLGAGDLVMGGGAGGAPVTTVNNNTLLVSGTAGLNMSNSSTGDGWNFQRNSVLGTNDLNLVFTPAGVSAYSIVEDQGPVGLALSTNGARAVRITPNRTITSTFPSGGGQTYTGSAPAITLTGTTPYLNESGPLIQMMQCSFNLTTSTLTTALSPVNLCTITLPNAAVVWRVNCQGGWSVTAGTTPTFAVGNNWAQTPSAVAADANIGTTNAGVAVEGFTSSTSNANIVATGSLTTSATIFPVTWWTTFTGSATSGAYHPTASVTGTSATGTLVGFCTIE
jgi:hypothetical protein